MRLRSVMWQAASAVLAAAGSFGAWVVLPYSLNVASGTASGWWPVSSINKHPYWWMLGSALVLYAGSQVFLRRLAARPPAGPADDALRERFAGHVRELASDAAERFELLSPVRLLWTTGNGPWSARRGAVFPGEPGSSWARRPLDGDQNTLAKVLLDLPHRQMVVLGEAGAGKSACAILLTHGLAGKLAADDPIPVLVPAAGWDPQAQDLLDYVSGQVPEAFRPLVRRGSVLPVLDGLDELPAAWHPVALRRLRRYDGPLVVTCRGAEYDRAVAATGWFLPRAALVELQPVTARDAGAYLTDTTAEPERWRPVFDGMGAPPLSDVFASPLMVTLAAKAYRKPGRDPAELLALPDRAAVEERLLDGFVEAAYEDAGPARAQRRLTTLAHQLDVAETRTLRWGRLDPDLFSEHPTGLRVALVLLVLLPAAIVPMLLVFLVLFGLVADAVAGPLLVGMFAAYGLLCAWGLARYWPRYRFRDVDVPLWLGYGFFLGMVAGCLAGNPGRGVLAGLGFGALLAVLPWRAPRPARAGGRYDFPPTRTAPPRMRDPAVAALLHATAAFLICTAVARPGGTLAGALPLGLAGAAVFGVAAGLVTGWLGWLGFRATHLRLVRAGRLPLRLRAFLDDAYRRGVLRRSGDAWQFRHTILLEHLARRARDHAVAVPDGGWAAASRLLDRDDIDGLRALAATSDAAAYRLADWLCDRDRTAEATEVLAGRARAGAGHPLIVRRLAEMHLSAGAPAEAVPLFRTLAADGDWAASWRLSQLGADAGQPDAGGEQPASGGGTPGEERRGAAAWHLLAGLAADGEFDELGRLITRWADDDVWAPAWLGMALLVRGRRMELAETRLVTFGTWADHLRRKADDDDLARSMISESAPVSEFWEPAKAGARVVRWGANRIAEALAADGRIGELRDRPAGFGDMFAAVRCLARVLPADEAVELLRRQPARAYVKGLLAECLAGQGRFDEALAALGRRFVTRRLDGLGRAEVLAAAGRTADLAALAARDHDSVAATHYVAGLVAAGQVAEAVEFLDHRRGSGASRLFAGWAFEERARVEELRVRADLGGWTDARRLAGLLDRQERAEAEIRAEPEPCRRALLLALRGRLAEAVAVMRAESHPDDPVAGALLANLAGELASLDSGLSPAGPVFAGPPAGVAGLLLEQGRRDEAIHLLSAVAGRPGDEPAAWQLVLLLGPAGPDLVAGPPGRVHGG